MHTMIPAGDYTLDFASSIDPAMDYIITTHP